MKALLASLAVGVALVATPQTAHAQADSAAAEALFTEGRTLLAQGKRDLACKRFEESYAIDKTAMGTLFNIAICNERRGRLATAWLQYREVAATSRTARADRANLADERARDLKPRLSTLRVNVPAEVRGLPALEISVDGAPLPPTSYGVPIPVDGGEHRVTAKARGRRAVTLSTAVAPERAAGEVSVPPLALDPNAAAEPTKPAGAAGSDVSGPSRESTPKGRTLAWVVGATGVAALALGAGFGTSVLVQQSTVKDQDRPYSERESKYRELDTQAYIADVGVGVGLALVATSAILLLTSRGSDASPSTARVVPVIATRAVGVRF